MRAVLLAVLVLTLGCGAALAEEGEETEEAPDAWLGCWTHVYDAVHLSKHPGQKVSALTLSIAARESESGDAPGKYAAKLTALLRDQQAVYATPEAARCVDAADKLTCFTDGFLLGKFTVERAGKNVKLSVKGADEHVALVPGVDLAAFVVLSPENPEHTLFLLNPAPAKACGK